MADTIAGLNTKNLANFGYSEALKKDIVGKDEFLKLLTFQLKNQNPMSPTENQEFAAQLAQFSQLEQLTDIRSLMEEQLGNDYALNSTLMNSALPGLLGKTAKVSTSKIAFSGEESIKLGYSLNQNAQKVKIVIRDSSGAEVRTIDFNNSGLSKGDHDYSWDGKDNNGNIVANGNYSFTATAYSGNGSSYSADSYVNGKIESVRFKPDGTFIVINGSEIALHNLIDISA